MVFKKSLPQSGVFADRLIVTIKQKKSPICVGIDPQLPRIPEFIKEACKAEKGKTFEAAAEAFLEFGKGIIDAVSDLVPIIKVQVAFYEQYGFPGMWAFGATCAYAKKKGLMVIADAKRNDIASTAEAYAKAYLGEVDLFGEAHSSFDVDAVTVNPYLGFDGVQPFVEACNKYDKGIFVLVKTSNVSSGDLQDRIIVDDRMRNYELVARLLESWSADNIGTHGYTSIGAVVGATFPQEAKRLRSLLPHSIFLVPGYGAQGATVDGIRPCFNIDNLGAIINSSRKIIFAFEESDAFGERGYKDAARDAVLKMQKELGTLGSGS